MGNFLLFIAIIFFLIIGLGALFIFRFLRLITKGTKTSSAFGNTGGNEQYSQQSRRNESRQHSQEKVFSKDEGEYVDYEEIK